MVTSIIIRNAQELKCEGREYDKPALIVAALLLGLTAPTILQAAERYPTRPVRIIVPFAPGGGIDSLARLTASELARRFDQPFIVENQSGGGGTIGSAALANANPDGYTLIFQASSSAAVAPAAGKLLSYDPIKAFAPVSLVADFPTVLVVNKDLPVSDLKSFVELLRSDPGKYSYGTAGPGTISHLTSELFRLKTKTKIQHVPYRGMTPASQDVLTGNITFVIDAVSAQLGNINGGLVAHWRSLRRNGADSFPMFRQWRRAGSRRSVSCCGALSMRPRTLQRKSSKAVERLCRNRSRSECC